MSDHGGEHAGQLEVLREDGLAGRLRFAVDARRALTDTVVGRWIFRLHLGRHRQLRRVGHQLAKARRLAGLVLNDAGGNRDLVCRHAPSIGRCRHQHGARGGTGRLQLIVRIRDRGAAARALERAEREIVIKLRVSGRASTRI